MTASDPIPSDLSVTQRDGTLVIAGALTVWTLGALQNDPTGQIELSGLTRLDTAGAWYLAKRQSAGAVLSGLSAPHLDLVRTVSDAIPNPDPLRPEPPAWQRMLTDTGRRVVEGLGFFLELATLLGRFLAALWRSILGPGAFRMTSLVHHCQETGLRAVPIVVLISFLIGVVLAFQGATQLQQFGAEVFVVDLIAISVLRELGILLTAIVVAGRTASALTASIGSMKMREEIDAMRTLGLDPDMVLVLPRVLALVLMLPILGLIANLSGLIGGAVMSWIELGISPSMFLTRLSMVNVNHVIVGMVKAPVFAVVIGIIGCHAGMKVGKDAESLGAMTSKAVVNAIFAVIIIDALFSVFFSEVGL